MSLMFLLAGTVLREDDPPATDVAMEGASEAAESSAPATATDAAAAVDATRWLLGF